MKLRAWVTSVSVLLSLAGCAEKRVATTFTAMEKRVPAGTTVYVTTTNGEHLRGRFADVSASSVKLSLGDGSTRDFTPSDVAEIRMKDPLWNGVLIGGAAGLMVGAMSDESCTARNASPHCLKISHGAGVAISAGIGATIGAAIDALHHRLVFRGAPARP